MEQFEGIFTHEYEDSYLTNDEIKYLMIVEELKKYDGKKIRITVEEIEE